MRLIERFVAAAVIALLVGCSSTPRPYIAEIRPLPSDQEAYDRAFVGCVDQVADQPRRGGLEKSSGVGAGTAIAGGAALGVGAAAGGLGGLAAATVGAGLVLVAPVAAITVSSTIRHRRERAIMQAMGTCLSEQGYAVARWRRLKQEEARAGVLASPTGPREITEAAVTEAALPSQ